MDGSSSGNKPISRFQQILILSHQSPIIIIILISGDDPLRRTRFSARKALGSRSRRRELFRIPIKGVSGDESCFRKGTDSSHESTDAIEAAMRLNAIKPCLRGKTQ
uniref:Uncharacterized protein n=1 Tax=Boechera divaricarpa TaxID=115915 RepID=B2BXT2_9BRAS|nr:unknown polyprotein-PA [Boechera divaricarpa]